MQIGGIKSKPEALKLRDQLKNNIPDFQEAFVKTVVMRWIINGNIIIFRGRLHQHSVDISGNSNFPINFSLHFPQFQIRLMHKNTKSYSIVINYGNELDNNIQRFSNFFCNYSSSSFSHKFKADRQRKHWIKFHFILYGLIYNPHPSDSYFNRKSYQVILYKTPHHFRQVWA